MSKIVSELRCKNDESRTQNQACLSYAEAHLIFALQSYREKISYTAYKCIQLGKCMHHLNVIL